MGKETEPEVDQSAWDTETGLINDVDGWISPNSKFGKKDEYAAAVSATGVEGGGDMFIAELVDENGEIIAEQGFSIGKGWIVSDNGLSISHPKRKNVVGSTRYGQLQNRVVRELKVDMASRGLPTEASSWFGLGFHWMQEEHDTVGGDKKTGTMPVEALEVRDMKVAAATTTPQPTSDIEKELVALIGKSKDVKAFQLAATKMPGVSDDDTLMASVLDDGPEGFYTKHKS